MNYFRDKSHRSFTLIELLVVISIIALLIALLMPALQKARKVAQAAMCMGNSRQYVTAISSYLYDNNGWYPRSVATLPEDPEAWQSHTSYLFTLEPYFNDWKILTDPGRDNPEVPPENDKAIWYWRSLNYRVVGHTYVFYDERDVIRGLGARTRIDDVLRPSKSLLTNCTFWWNGRGAGSGLYGSEEQYPGALAYNSRDNVHIPTTPGGIHNGTETFTFMDGHGGLFSTTPIHEYWLATNSETFTYPPNVVPAEAQWWTMPYFPDYYPYFTHMPLPGLPQYVPRNF